MLVGYHVSGNGKAVYQCGIPVVASETDRYLSIVNRLAVPDSVLVLHLAIVKHCESLVEEDVRNPVIVKHFCPDAPVDHRVNVNGFDAVEDVSLFVFVASPVLHPLVLVHLSLCPCPDHQQVYLQVDIRP